VTPAEDGFLLAGALVDRTGSLSDLSRSRASRRSLRLLIGFSSNEIGPEPDA
jgi:hypothetical protein